MSLPFEIPPLTHIYNFTFLCYAAVRPESPIEEVSNAFYGKTIKFAMTHDVEVDLPEIVFNGATFRISPRSIEGNGLIAKLELIPKQIVQARLAGTMIKKKIRKLPNPLSVSALDSYSIVKQSYWSPNFRFLRQISAQQIAAVIHCFGADY